VEEVDMSMTMRSYTMGSLNGLGSAWVGTGIGWLIHGEPDYGWIFLAIGAAVWLSQSFMLRRDWR
jgi:hypothetical protein